ncbi:hypothetical protein D1007_37758 [Hordeum vulgare]|nr:hypothetical protein D1007_37758 [Hordeum vulgare]
MERQTERLQNVTAFFVWVWTENPDYIPKAADLTIVERAGDGRNRYQLPDGVPAKEGWQGPMTGVLIHLVLAKDYSPVASDCSTTPEYPRIYTYNVQIGTMDGRVVLPRHPSDASSSRLPRRWDDDDADDEGQGRQHRRRTGKRRSLWQFVVGQAQCRDTAWFDPAPCRGGCHGERWGRAAARHRAPSRSSDRDGRWCTSRSPPPAPRQAASASSYTAIPAGSVRRPPSCRFGHDTEDSHSIAMVMGHGSSGQAAAAAGSPISSPAAAQLPSSSRAEPAARLSLERISSGERWKGATSTSAALSPLEEVLIAAFNNRSQQFCFPMRPSSEDAGLHGSMLYSFGVWESLLQPTIICCTI